jgi:hypothetical protein
MKQPGAHTIRQILGKMLTVSAVIMLSHVVVFAIDGTLGGGKSGSKSTFSTLKKDLNISLKSGYAFGNNKSYGFSRQQPGMFNSVVTYNKGNITYYVPMKNKPMIQKFRTPSAPVIR